MTKTTLKSNRVLRAYCWANGVIRFGYTTPEGALELGCGRPGLLREKVTVLARLAYDNKTLLVPGVPENKGTMRAVDAVTAFCRELKKRL